MTTIKISLAFSMLKQTFQEATGIYIEFPCTNVIHLETVCWSQV